MKISFFEQMDCYRPGIPFADLRNTATERVKLAEKLGFDCFYISQHYFSGLGTCSSPYIFLAGLAKETSRIKLGVAVTPLHLVHPVQLAADALELDALSGGRFVLGLGSGVDKAAFKNFNMTYPDSSEKVIEAYKYKLDVFTQTVISTLSSGQKSIDQKIGESNSLSLSIPTHADFLDRIYLASVRKETTIHIGKHGFNLMISPFEFFNSTHNDLTQAIKFYREGFTQAEQKHSSGKVSALIKCCIGQNPGKEQVAKVCFNFFKNTLNSLEGEKKVDFYELAKHKSQGIFGSKDQIKSFMHMLSEAGVDEVILMMTLGNMPSSIVEYGMEAVMSEMS